MIREVMLHGQLPQILEKFLIKKFLITSKQDFIQNHRLKEFR